MSFAEDLKNLLRPLGVYDLEGTINAASLEAKGAALDGMGGILEDLERESDLTRAESWGLECWRTLFGLLPATRDPGQLRESIWALLRIGAGNATLGAIRDTLSGCGLTVTVEERGTGTVAVSFPGVAGIPENFSALKANIEEILPVHVGVEYLFDYVTWAKLEGYGWTFGDLSAMTWEELEKHV